MPHITLHVHNVDYWDQKYFLASLMGHLSRTQVVIRGQSLVPTDATALVAPYITRFDHNAES